MIGEEKQTKNNCCERLGNKVQIIRSLARNLIEQKHLSKGTLLDTCIIPPNTNSTKNILVLIWLLNSKDTAL